jgi:FkbM family methyltransferase
MSLSRLLSRLSPSFEIVVADVGSAGGLAKRWAPAAEVVAPLLFDPREGGHERREGRARVFPVALAAGPGVARLNLTALGNMSSTLTPNAALLARFRKKPAHTRLVGCAEMPADSLDNVARAAGVAVDVLKVDTQGSELEILRGAEASLRSSIFFAEVEVSFLERYRGQVLADGVICHLRERGFELVDLYRPKRYRHANSAGVANVSLGAGQRAGRLAYADAWFMLGEDAFAARIEAVDAARPGAGAALAQKAMIVLLVYGKADMAARLYDIVADRLDPPARAAWGRHLRGLARRAFGLQNLHHVVDYLARRA